MTSGSVCTVSFYLGPKDEQAVAPVDARLEETFEHSGMLSPLSKLLLKLLNFIYRYVHNYGYAIIILTVLIRLFMLPFTLKGERSMKQGAQMQERMDYLKKKYKNDPERMRLEQAELIKKHGMPQIVGCLPMLLQFPIFIALNRVLSNSVELYQAPFIGWLQDLSAPDPYYVLPILIMLSMLANAFTLDPKQRTTMIIAAVALGAFSINFASGLLIYLIASTVAGVLQSYFTKSLRTA
jgi:YidC/Oxa1 family membrane protein insertase